MEQISFLAFDLGATSGRSILGTLRDGKLQMKELTRFPNQILELGGYYYWNIFRKCFSFVQSRHFSLSPFWNIKAIS